MKIHLWASFFFLGFISACHFSDNKISNSTDSLTTPILLPSANPTSSTNSPRFDTLTPLLKRYPLASWPRKTVVEIGCMLEQELQYRDSTFNCAYKNYENQGDPCVNTQEYYEGIEFPAKFVSTVHPAIKELSLDFEHGNLREIRITLVDSFHRDSVRKIFQLPLDPFPENIMHIAYGENVGSKDKPTNPDFTRWLTIYGFEHMGSGDVDCGE